MPTRRSRFFMPLAACVLIPGRATAQQSKPAPDSANIAVARRLLDVMHQGEGILAGIETAMNGQRRQNRELAPVFYDSLFARMKRTVPEVLDSIAPSYARRFKRAELEEMIRFYESPTGQDFASQQASLSLEAVQFGQRWGVRLAAAVMKDLTDAGVSVTSPQ